MSRIRTVKQARTLRPIAVERARASRLIKGEQVFFGGICYGMVKLAWTYEHKPYRIGMFIGKSTAFTGPMTHAYPTLAEYEASGVHWR